MRPAAPGRLCLYEPPDMTDLNDQAKEVEHENVVLSGESHGLYKITATELVEANDVSPEGEFPKYGKYLPVEQLDRGGTSKGEALLESPRGLAVSLTEAGLAEDGAKFWIRNVSKDVEGTWVFDVEPAGAAPGWEGD